MDLFKLAYNSTGIYQGTYRDTGDVLHIPPHFVADMANCRHLPPGFNAVPNFLEFINSRGLRKFSIQRSFAFGDVLMGIPVVRYCNKIGYETLFRTSSEFLEIASKLVPTESTQRTPNEDSIGISMDWVLERDHGSSVLSPFHRVEIYFRALGMKMPSVDELDWSMDLDAFPKNPVKDESYVVFQGHGANRNKQLPLDSIWKICTTLNENGIKVYYTGNPQFGGTGPLTVHTQYGWSKKEMFSAIAGARCLVTMDSSPLWISHFTRTPTVVILGPTGTELQRSSLHPLYPEGVVSLKMNEWIDCPTCYEKASACSHSMRCLNSNQDRLIKETVENVMRFWSSYD